MTTQTVQTSKYSACYIGDGDPSPVYVDLSPAGVHLSDGSVVGWPAGARFAVELRPFSEEVRVPKARLEFFGSDGWPLNFPQDLRDLGDSVKVEFQTWDWGWAEWRHSSIARLKTDELWLRRLRLESEFIVDIHQALPRPIAT